MKSYNHLMERYLSKENYREAVRNCTRRKGKNGRKNKRMRYIRDHADEMEPYFLNEAAHFKSSEHTPKTIYDGVRRKKRQILIPTEREQVIHHMAMNVMQPIFQKGMYEHSYGSIPGRGAHAAKKRIEKWIRKGGRSVKYVLKMDIKKYYDSVPHDILKRKLAEIVHDQEFLTVLYEIVDANGTDRGIPIGFYTSQWFANWYLTELDHYIKEVLHVKYFVRYVDDMVIFGGNKRELHQIRRAIEAYLRERLGLTMKENWQVYLFHYIKRSGKEIGRDLDFLGFRFYRNRTTLRRSVMLKATRKARRIAKKSVKTIYDCRQMLSYLGWIKATDTYGMYRKHVKPFVNFQNLKRRASAYQKHMNKKEALKHVA
jgi:retron-type reverse transcriptase